MLPVRQDVTDVNDLIASAEDLEEDTKMEMRVASVLAAHQFLLSPATPRF